MALDTHLVRTPKRVLPDRAVFGSSYILISSGQSLLSYPLLAQVL